MTDPPKVLKALPSRDPLEEVLMSFFNDGVRHQVVEGEVWDMLAEEARAGRIHGLYLDGLALLFRPVDDGDALLLFDARQRVAQDRMTPPRTSFERETEPGSRTQIGHCFGLFAGRT